MAAVPQQAHYEGGSIKWGDSRWYCLLYFAERAKLRLGGPSCSLYLESFLMDNDSKSLVFGRQVEVWTLTPHRAQDIRWWVHNKDSDPLSPLNCEHLSIQPMRAPASVDNWYPRVRKGLSLSLLSANRCVDCTFFIWDKLLRLANKSRLLIQAMYFRPFQWWNPCRHRGNSGEQTSVYIASVSMGPQEDMHSYQETKHHCAKRDKEVDKAMSLCNSA